MLYMRNTQATRDTSVCMIQQHDVQEFLKSIRNFVKAAREMSQRLENPRQTAQVAVECHYPFSFVLAENGT